MNAAEPHAIDAAVAALRAGQAIGLPTETVYGLAADARNDDAVRRIFAIKGRPADHPLIVHLGDAAWLDDWAAEIPDAARTLAERFWPGPLTMILPRAACVSDLVTGRQATVGVRMPSHPVALAVLRAFGGALAAPSANRFGHVSPTRAEHVRQEFGDAVPIVLEGGDCEVGIESTIVDLTGRIPRILRPGRISQSEIEAALERKVQVGALAASPRVSGSLDSHYAPNATAQRMTRDAIVERIRTTSPVARGHLRVIALEQLPANATGAALPRDPQRYAHDLYATLRALDQPGVTRILIESPPQTPEWTAVNDRLLRATASRGEPEGT